MDGSDLNGSPAELLEALVVAGSLGLLHLAGGVGPHGASLLELVALHVWWFSVKHIARLDAVLDDADCPVEDAHEVRSGVTVLVGQNAAVLLAHGNEELVDAH